MGWDYGSRCNLFLAIRVLALGDTTEEEAGCCAHKLLEELELYKDPAQGKDFFWQSEEFPIIDQLACKLKDIVGDDYPAASGQRAIRHPAWNEVIKLAKQLLPFFRKNGLGPP